MPLLPPPPPFYNTSITAATVDAPIMHDRTTSRTETRCDTAFDFLELPVPDGDDALVPVPLPPAIRFWSPSGLPAPFVCPSQSASVLVS